MAEEEEEVSLEGMRPMHVCRCDVCQHNAATFIEWMGLLCGRGRKAEACITTGEAPEVPHGFLWETGHTSEECLAYLEQLVAELRAQMLREATRRAVRESTQEEARDK